MKKHLFFAAVALATMSAFTSCSKEDNAGSPVVTIISFENQTLNKDGFWIGEAKGESYSYEDDWGGKTTTYTDNAYKEAGVKFPVSYSIYESQYGSTDFWSGFAISNRTATTFDPMTLTPDQYNNVTGKAHSGDNFMVITTYGEFINFEEGVKIKGFYFTNSAYTANSIVNGDSYSGAKFDKTDWLKCTLTGVKKDGTTVDVDIDLAKNGDYVKDWQWIDLSAMGEIGSLYFAFSGSRSNDYGVLTPAYICIDDMVVE